MMVQCGCFEKLQAEAPESATVQHKTGLPPGLVIALKALKMRRLRTGRRFRRFQSQPTRIPLHS